NEQEMADYATEILQADNATKRQYQSSSGAQVNLFSAYFKSQKYGSQIHSPKHCLPGGGWRIDKLEPYAMELADGSTKTVNRMYISLNNYRAVMLYWFETRSGSVRDEYGLKLDLVKNSLLFRPTDAAIVRITVDAPNNDFETATQTGILFYNEMRPYLTAALPF
ncbi:MAG: exosortase C-terminal domain/associated protein EpsI, partial [Candidatus Zixiibacteriota bacterium]